MHVQRPLRPAILSAAAHVRARHRQILFVTTAAALGCLMGGASIFLALRTGDSIAQPEVRAADILPSPVLRTSPIARGEEVPVPASPARALSIINADSPRLVLDVDVDDAWLAAAAAEIVESGDLEHVLERPVITERLPASLAAVQGQAVSIALMNGVRCEGVVGKLSALRVIFGDEAISDDLSIAEAWSWGRPALVATIEGLPANCSDDIAGAVVGGASIDVLRASSLAPNSSLAVAALASWRAHAAWTAIEARYDREREEGRAHWDSDIEPEVTLVGSADDGIAVVSLSAGECGTFESTLTLAFQIERGRVVANIPMQSDLPVSDVLGAVKSTSDRLPTLFVRNYNYSTDVLTGSEGGFATAPGADVTVNLCRC